MTVSVPPEKVELLCKELRMLLELKDQVETSVIRSVVGRIIFYSRAVRGARTFTRRMLSYLKYRIYHTRCPRPLSKEYILEREMVASCFESKQRRRNTYLPEVSTSVFGCLQDIENNWRCRGSLGEKGLDADVVGRRS